MLENIKQCNIVLPISPRRDTQESIFAGVLIWSGWFMVYPYENPEVSILKEKFTKFKFVSVPS